MERDLIRERTNAGLAAARARGRKGGEEINRLKANMEDPRLSGLDAVHGVPIGPNPRGIKMSEQEGLEFIVRLLNTYLDRQP
jgi:hypothetical protein